MSYEINEVVIIDESRNIVNAGVGTFTKVHPAELEVGSGGHTISDVLDETDLISDSPNALPTQHAVKSYVDTAILAVQSDVDANELASGNAELALDLRLYALEVDPTTQTLLGAEETARVDADYALSSRLDTLEADPTTQTLLGAEETARVDADYALSSRLDTLEADPTTAAALAAVQAVVDQNEADADAAESVLSGRLDTLEADPTTAAALAAVQAVVDQNESDSDAADYALSSRLDILEADPTTAAAVAAVQAVVDQNESDSDAAESVLSGRLDTLEADPTTAAAVAAVQAVVDQNEADADAAIAANEVHIDNAATLSGVAKDSTDLGTFTGSIISDSRTIKAALQDLETGVDNALGGGAAATSVETITTATDANHYLTFVNTDNTTGTQESVFTDAGIQYNPSSDTLTVGEVVISGNLTVNGSQTVINTTTITTEDKNITLGNTSTPTDTTADGGGFTLQGATDKTFNWINATGSFTASEHIDLASGKQFLINNVGVLSATTLGGSVVNSSLTSVGTLTDLTVADDITANGNIVGDGASNISGINSVTAAGKMYAQSYTSTSDANLKENIAEIPNAVEKVEAIRGVTFDWKDGSGSTAGIIAQEVEAVMPMLIENGEFKRVEYNGLVGLLIEAVKELSAEVKALKAN